IGRIDEVDAELECALDDAPRVLQAERRLAEGIAAEAERRNLEAGPSELAVFQSRAPLTSELIRSLVRAASTRIRGILPHPKEAILPGNATPGGVATDLDGAWAIPARAAGPDPTAEWNTAQCAGWPSAFSTRWFIARHTPHRPAAPPR